MRLRADSGLQAEVLTLGATLHGVYVPTDAGAVDVVLGKLSLEGYLQNGLCNSSVIGRCANRIEGGTFTLNGRRVQLERNFGGHCIHGGSGCYAAKNFAFSVLQEPQALRLHMTHLDDGAGGFPGQLFFSVDYVLRDSGVRPSCTAAEAMLHWKSGRISPACSCLRSTTFRLRSRVRTGNTIGRTVQCAWKRSSIRMP